MSELDVYLARHFLRAEQLATACGVSLDALRRLVDDGLVPEPSYVVSQSTMIASHVFGEMPAPGAENGDYFHVDMVNWVTRAQQVVDNVGYQHAYEALKQDFEANMEAALAAMNGTIWRLCDSFADDGSALTAGLRTRLDSLWEHFLHGTFGLCVAHPVSEAAIARKEILQEKLSALSEKGAKSDYPEADVRPMLELIDAYADAAMPFSPIEYPVSSRKRLVDDLRARITSHGAAAVAKSVV